MIHRLTFGAGIAAVMGTVRISFAQETLYRVGVFSELPRFTSTEDRWRMALRGWGYTGDRERRISEPRGVPPASAPASR